MLKGTLDDFTLPDMFRLMSFAKKTGRLDVDRRAGHGSVFFREGEVYYAESSLTKIPLGQKLLRAGAITESQLNKALDTNAESGERVGEILLTSGAVDGEQLEAALRAQIEDAVFDLLRWDLGEFSWEPGAAVEPEVGIMVSVENLIMEASRRLDELEVITRKIPSGLTVLKMADKPPEGAVEINITPEEWRILVLVDGVRTVTQIGEVVGLDEFDAMRTLYGLVSAGLIEVDSTAAAEPDEEPDAPDATVASEPAEIIGHEADAVADATDDDAVEDATQGASGMDPHEADTSESAAEVSLPEDAGEIAADPAPSATGSPGDDLIAEQEAAGESSFDSTAFDAESQAVAEAFGEAAPVPDPAQDLVDQASGQLDPSELIQDPVAAGEADSPPESWFVDPAVPVDSFDEPAPGELDTSEPPSPADSILNELLGDASTEGQPSDRAESEPPDAPQPPRDPAPQPPADAPRVDRAAVVRELAGLFGDEERPRSRAASPARPGEPEAPEAPEAVDGDQRKRVEDDDQVNRGLISRLIDGVKGL